jgi:ribonuclease HI
MSLVIYTDGGARGNPGPAGIGIVIEDDGKIVGEIKKYLGDNLTNNWAEYQALIAGLGELVERDYAKRKLEVRMDSELIVKQMKGEYKVKHPDLKPLHMQVRELLHHFPHTTFTHIPREKNKIADRLVNEAIDGGV